MTQGHDLAASHDGQRRRWRWRWWGVASAVAYLAVGVAAQWQVWTAGHPASTATCACGDPAQAMWFLAWVPYALGHGQWPWHSSLMFAGQGGVNLLGNTGDLLQSLVVSPVTVTAGPVVALNLAITVAPLVSGLCAVWAAAKVVRWPAAAAMVGLLWACSPLVLGHAPFGHLNLAWAVGPPLLFGALWELVVRQRHAWAHDARVLVVAVVVTFFVSTEQLALCVVVAGITLGVCLAGAGIRAGLGRSTPLRCRLVHGARAGGAGAAASVVLLGWPTWYALAGPRHVSGPPWPGTAAVGAAIGAPVVGGDHLMPAALAALAGFRGVPGPALDYLGPILAAVLVCSLLATATAARTWVLAVAAVVGWALSWGVVGTRWTPWRLFAGLPVLQDITPDRFGALAFFAAALLIGIGLDRCSLRLMPGAVGPAAGAVGPAAGAGGSALWSRPRLAPGAGRVLLGLVALVVVGGLAADVSAEHLPYPVVAATAPAWFTATAAPAPSRRRVLVVPYPSSGITAALAWQAIGGMRIDLVGGYGLAPPPGHQDGPAVRHSPAGSFDGILDALTFALHTRPTATTATVTALWAGIRSTGVATVVVAPIPPGSGPTPAAGFSPAQAGYAAGLIAAAVGRPPRWEKGAWVFADVGADPGPAAR